MVSLEVAKDRDGQANIFRVFLQLRSLGSGTKAVEYALAELSRIRANRSFCCRPGVWIGVRKTFQNSAKCAKSTEIDKATSVTLSTTY